MLKLCKTSETFFVSKVSIVYLPSIMKEKIITKSTELFLTLGFKSVTMDDIANEMGISKKTIYLHYSNKNKLVEQVTFNLFNIICDDIDHVCENSNNPIEELYDIKKLVMSHLKNEKVSPQYQLKKYYPGIYAQLKLKEFEVMHDSVKESLTKGKEMKLFRSDIDVDFISRMYFNGMTGIKDSVIFPNNLFTVEYLTESYLEYHLRAIVTEQGLKILNNFINTNQSL